MTTRIKHYPHGRCTAKSKTTGNRCRNDAVSEFTVCRIHGGLSPTGANSPAFKHGNYSKHLPKRLLHVHDAAFADPELLDLTRDVALQETFIRETLDTMKNAPEAATAWSQLKQALDDLQNAIVLADVMAIDRSVKTMRRTIDERNRYHAARREVRAILSEKRQTVESITRTETAKERTFTIVEVATLMAAIVALIQREVRDTREQYALLSGVEKLVTLEAE